MHILRCASSRTSFKGGDVTVNIYEKVCKLNIPPMHILRCASSRTSFKGGDAMVRIHEH